MSPYRRSSAVTRWALVAPVIPLPSGPSSTTTTDRPSAASRYAVVKPAIPAPTTHTSARTFVRIDGSLSGSKPSHQTGSFLGSDDSVMTFRGCSRCATRRWPLVPRHMTCTLLRPSAANCPSGGTRSTTLNFEGTSSEPAHRGVGNRTGRPEEREHPADARHAGPLRAHGAHRRRRLRRRLQGLGRADEPRGRDQGLHARRRDASAFPPRGRARRSAAASQHHRGLRERRRGRHALHRPGAAGRRRPLGLDRPPGAGAAVLENQRSSGASPTPSNTRTARG